MYVENLVEKKKRLVKWWKGKRERETYTLYWSQEENVKGPHLYQARLKYICSSPP